MSRIESSRKNIISGTVFQGMYLVMNFAIRILILRKAGIEALSLNGLFTEVIWVLSIAELGVGVSISYSLYKPLAEHDEEKTASVMRIFKKAYMAIGIAVFIAGMLVMPFLRHLITGMDPDMGYVRFVFFIFILQSAVPYFFSFKSALLNADQKNYVVTRMNLFIRTFFFILEGAVLIFTGNYVLYLGIQLLYNVVFQVVVSREVDKRYPYLKNAKPLPKKETAAIFTNVRRMFVGRLSNRVLNSTDNILISTLVNTAMVGVYSQYSMLINGFLRL